ncbi:Putative Malic enzyme [Rhizopus microsporus]|nr:Putative Malic enzyme [Rhizopus microsporus]CEI93433.1 Putative Malic enzyme [Rhizopus microsporus]
MSPSVATIPTTMSGYDNEGTATEYSKRKALGLTGLLPSRVETLDIQRRRALRQVRSKSTPLEKYIFLAQLRSSNTRLFYKLIMDDLQEFAPIIYTPTVGTACIEYSNIYPFLAAPGMPDGLYIDSTDLNNLKEVILNYQPVPNFDPEIAVITDGSRILGLGDLGSNGIGISIGKLQLYVAGAGIDPRRTLPIVLDLGTNNEKLRNDEFYLGLRKPRPSDDEFYSIVDTVLETLHSVYPQLLIQFEDWSSEHAFGLLEKYQHKLLCFNDDIQGTGAVILSGVINAIRRVQQESRVDPRDHRIVFYGAGSAAIGVARQIQTYFEAELGMTEEEARKVFWIVDSKGLVTLDRGDRLAQHKVYYARQDNAGQQFKDLMDIINHVKPTALIGLSSIPGAFHKQALTRLAELNEQPIVFPLSNPATQAECTFAEAMEATENRVIFASGTAFPSYTIPSTGQVCIPGQGNNMYIFPGLGLGSVLAQPKHISDKMIYAASKALADSLTSEEINQKWLYPSLVRIREVSNAVATAVIEESIHEGLSENETLKGLTHEELVDYVSNNMWSPVNETYGIVDASI